MRRIVVCLLLIVICAAPFAAATAELTNLKLQRAGGYAAVNSSDTYFFSMTGSFEENKWGLYSVKKLDDGPLAEVTSIQPSRLVYADGKNVYFLGVRPDKKLMLAKIDLATHSLSPVLERLEMVLCDSETTFFYVQADDLYTLYRYDIAQNKSTNIKKMTSKMMYDACTFLDQVYMIVFEDANKNGVFDNNDVQSIYKIDKRSNKASQLSTLNPKMGGGYLLDGRVVYYQRGDTTRIYSVEIGKTKAVRLGDKITAMTLYSPTYAGALYPYNADTNTLYRVPVDGSGPAELTLSASGRKSVILGGTEDMLYYWDDGAIYAVTPSLTNRREVARVDLTGDEMEWTTITPTNQSSLIFMGYIPATAGGMGITLPTALKIIDLESGSIIYEYPVPDVAPAPNSTQPGAAVMPANDDTVYEDVPVGDYDDLSFSDLFNN